MDDPGKILSLSKIFHERTRLAIMTVLAARNDEIDFNDLLKVLDVSKGNLVVHINKLEEAGYVEISKRFVGKKPRTSYLATNFGRKEFNNYLELLENIITQAKDKI